jgi:hypothetical protein
MPTTGRTKLPVLKIKTLPPPPQFAPGARVALKNCPGPAGVVRGMRWGKVLVKWRDVNILGRHKPEALTLADEGEMDHDQQQAE